MSSSARLEERSQERDTLLAIIVDLLKTDKRVAAAWLGGSLGRGNDDQLSDIDIYVVVAEQYARFVFGATKEFVSRIEGLLLTATAPRNAPADGAYLLTLYRGDTGPHQVDWYWITDRIHEIPANTSILFNAANIPEASLRLPMMQNDLGELENDIATFWALAAISAKKIARVHPWAAIALLGYMRSATQKVAWNLGVADTAPTHADLRSEPPPGDSSSQLAALKEIILEMEALSPAIVAAGLQNPQVMRIELAPLIDLTDVLISEKT